MSFPMVAYFEETMTRIAPYMSSTVARARNEFGPTWEEQLEQTLQRMFADDEKLESAIKGYVRFSLEAIKLQKRFEKERKYIPKSYREAANSVYHNEEYMHNLYLPGILLSHYLWPHHYRQLLYFHKNFMPRILASDEKLFCDVGAGTGFYSRQILCASDQIHGTAFDISKHAMNYATMQMAAFELLDRWTFRLQDVLQDKTTETWPFLVSVEVLEHLEDPVTFLKRLREMLRQGGTGFITAAITAPNADHIYLYNNCDEIIDQLLEADFEVVDYLEEAGYAPRKNEPVPRVGAFIVQ